LFVVFATRSPRTSVRWIVGALAVHSVGGVLVPINTRHEGDEAAYVLARSGVRLLITVDASSGCIRSRRSPRPRRSSRRSKPS